MVYLAFQTIMAKEQKERKVHTPRLSLEQDAYKDLLVASSLSGESMKEMSARLFKEERVKQLVLAQNRELK